MDVKTILFPTDLSDHSLKGLENARSLAAAYGARLVLLYVGFDLKEYFPAFGKPSAEHTHDFRDWETQEAEKRMKELCATKPDGCPASDIRIMEGEPAREILNYIKQHGVDLVVMTTHGKSGGRSDGLFGSTAEKVVRRAEVPVLVVTPGDG